MLKIDEKKKENLVVVKSNEVIAASYKLSLNEQRIILTCISKLDSMETLTKKRRGHDKGRRDP